MQPGGRNPDTSSYRASRLGGRGATRAAQTTTAIDDHREDGMGDNAEPVCGESYDHRVNGIGVCEECGAEIWPEGDEGEEG